MTQNSKNVEKKPVGLNYDEMDQKFQSNLATFTLGMTPAGLTKSYTSWLAQLAISPGRMTHLSTFFWDNFGKVVQNYLTSTPPNITDTRFKGEDWQKMPWVAYAEMFQIQEKFWDLATKNISGLSPRDEKLMSFMMRQMLDIYSPTNYVATNPELAKKTIEQNGMNLVNGTKNALDDLKRKLMHEPPAGIEKFKVGENLAVTEGKVVYKNSLMELIQYSPTQTNTYKNPVLIIPAWIMKYYILDLSEYNSMVKYLVDQGHDVFMISWKNPESKDKDYGMDEYVKFGSLQAIDIVSSIIPDSKINLVGYCLGGTLAMITTALLAHDKDERLNSLTLFAAQGDFTEAGEITLFVNHSQIEFLKNMMRKQGYLDTTQMSGAFEALRSYDLIWSRMVHDYLLGERGQLVDIMAWNADPTRMPYKMHSEYLEKLFLNNEFAEGKYSVLGKPIAPENINIPIFAVGTEKDHIAPWKSVYKIHLLSRSEVTFVLTNGGHNAGIVSEPGHKRRHYRIATQDQNSPYRSPDEWLAQSTNHEGSWWPEWNNWLTAISSETHEAKQELGNETYPPLYNAPGEYVFQR